MKNRKFNKGFTLMELIISIGIASIVLILTFQLLFLGNKIYNKTSVEYDIQAQIRYAVETINQNIRYSTVAFAVLGDHYTGAEDKLTKEWSYIGLSEDKKEIIHYKWDETQKKHIKNILVSSNDDLKFDLSFKQDPKYENERIISYSLKATKDDNKTKITEINTELEAINAIQIVDRGMHTTKKAVALAYRTDPTPTAQSQKAAIAMILDTSGSMAYDMDGTSPSKNVKWGNIIGELKVNGIKQNIGEPAKVSSSQWLDSGYWYYNSGGNLYQSYWEPTSYPNRGYVVKNNRISILKDQAQLLVEQFKVNKIEGDLKIIPFDTKADTTTNWQDIELKNIDLKATISSLTAIGGTNTGDGLRVAYHSIKEKNKNEIRRNYMIVLVDGVTTYYSGTSTNFFIGEGTASTINGNGSSLDTVGENYVKKIGEIIQKDYNITTFVIGFSDKWKDNEYVELKSVNTIAEACGIGNQHFFNTSNKSNPVKSNPEYVFWAKDEASLQNVFNSISKYIMADFWQVLGPDNK